MNFKNYKLLTISLFSSLLSSMFLPFHSTFAESSYPQRLISHYAILFHDVASQNPELSNQGCLEMTKSFTFDKKGQQFFFPNHSNPQFSNSFNVASLRLQHDQILEVYTVHTKFAYLGKDLEFPSTLIAVVNKSPYVATGLFLNQYCKAAFVLVPDDPSLLGHY